METKKEKYEGEDFVFIYAYRVINKETGMIIKMGTEETFMDVSIESLIPGISTYSDRCLSEVQDFLDKNYAELNYSFEYKRVRVDW